MPDQVRVRNLSPQGDMEVPDLGVVVEYRHEVIVEASVAQSLIDTGHWVAVQRPGDPGTGPSEPEPAGQSEPTPAPAGEPVTATPEPSEEQNQ